MTATTTNRRRPRRAHVKREKLSQPHAFTQSLARGLSNPASRGNVGFRGAPFIFTVAVTAGSLGFTIPTASVPGGYACRVNWGDGTSDCIASYNDPKWAHTYPAAGTYTVTITGTFARIYFNNGGDKLKITSIKQWGSVGWSSDQTRAFYGCTNLASIGEDVGWMNTTLTNGYFMFVTCPLTTLPRGLTLGALTNGTSMFYQCPLTALPEGMTLPSLLNGTSMFLSNLFTSLPAGMTLAALTNGTSMFRQVPLTTVPAGMTLASLTDGTSMFYAVTLSTPSYNQLWINIRANNNNNSVPFHGGFSRASVGPPDGVTPRNYMRTTKLWSVIDTAP